MYSSSIQQLIKAFSKLPSVGNRTAERYVFHLLKKGKKDAGELTLALKTLMENIKSCEICWNFSDISPCHICTDQKRNQTIICVVAEPQDLQVIEKTGEFKGVYHILRGHLDSDVENLDKLKIKELLERIKKTKPTEIILALNPDLKGETTIMFLQNKIKEIDPDINISRLARGLPMGSDLQYSDEITLTSALKNRSKLNG